MLGAARRLDGGRQSHHVPHGQLQDLSDGRDPRSLLRLCRRQLRADDGVLVFLAAATLAFGVMAAVRVRGAVQAPRRRTSRRRPRAVRRRPRARCAMPASRPAQRLIEYTTKHYSPLDDDEHEDAAPPAGAGRHSSIRARSPSSSSRAPCWRSALGARAFFVMPSCSATEGSHVLAVGRASAALVGYLAPELLLDRRIAKPPDRASRRLPGFHGSAGRLRRCRA